MTRPATQRRSPMTAFDELVEAASDRGILSRTVAPRDVVLKNGRISLILSGAVALLAPGEDVLVATAGPGDVLGAEALAGLESPLTGLWLTPGRVLDVPAHQLVDEVPPATVLRWLGEAFNMIQAALAREISCRAHHGITPRLADLLSSMSERGRLTVLHVSQAELGRLLAVQRTSVCAGIGELKQHGAARAIRGRTEILDALKLDMTACGCRPFRSIDGREAWNAPWPPAYLGMADTLQF